MKSNCSNCIFIARISETSGMCYNLHPLIKTSPIALKVLTEFKCSEYKKSKEKLWK